VGWRVLGAFVDTALGFRIWCVMAAVGWRLMGAEVENETLVWRGAGGRLVWESEVSVAVLGMVHGGSVAVIGFCGLLY
jgi:hypothetical protein